jgi:2'-5' RNA ligase
MKFNRAIHIFPEFNNSEILDNYRKKYDPLYNLINVHITLVFPFKSKLTHNDVKEHIRGVLLGVESFKISFHGFSKSSDGHIFLNVIDGFEELVRLNDKLYSGILSNFRNKDIEYSPHITIGKIEKEEELDSILFDLNSLNLFFKDNIRIIYTEIIDSKGNSIVESKFLLNNSLEH